MLAVSCSPRMSIRDLNEELKEAGVDEGVCSIERISRPIKCRDRDSERAFACVKHRHAGAFPTACVERHSFMH